MIIIPEEELIYFSKIKQYFREVITSYEIGNYRSAVVMLYSVTVCDLLLKLEELKNSNNDGIAIDILEKVEKTRTSDESKSKWEWELIDLVYTKTSFIDNEAYANVKSLYDYRNMCAHPAVNDSYELFQPNKETTIALIKNTAVTILIKPPIFIKKVIDSLVEYLADRRDTYVKDPESLKIFLDNKYYSRMNLNMKLKIARALWKFVFVLENEDCSINRRINYLALSILTAEISKELTEYIKENEREFEVAAEDTLCLNLIRYLSRHPAIWNALGHETKYQIEDLIQRNADAKAMSWFRYTNMTELLPELLNSDIRDNVLNRMYYYYVQSGYKEEILGFFIDYFGNSLSYNIADYRFEIVIKPFLKEMSGRQFENLVGKIDENAQLYRRYASEWDNARIAFEIYKRVGDGFDYSKYPHFKYSESLLASYIHDEETQGMED